MPCAPTIKTVTSLTHTFTVPAAAGDNWVTIFNPADYIDGLENCFDGDTILEVKKQIDISVADENNMKIVRDYANPLLDGTFQVNTGVY